VALNRGRHLCSAGRPSGWALARILVLFIVFFIALSVFWFRAADKTAYTSPLLGARKYTLSYRIKIELSGLKTAVKLLLLISLFDTTPTISLFHYRRVGRVASEEVVVDLMKKKCLPILYCAIDVCPLNKAHINSLDFAVGSCFSKIFCIKSRETIAGCMRLFSWQSVKDVADKRRQNFVKKYSVSRSGLYQLFT